MLARRLASGLGLAEPSASIVSLRVQDAETAEAASHDGRALRRARRQYSVVATHVYNTVDDIDRAIDALSRVST